MAEVDMLRRRVREVEGLAERRRERVVRLEREMAQVHAEGAKVVVGHHFRVRALELLEIPLRVFLN
jgi:hypothetical protein